MHPGGCQGEIYGAHLHEGMPEGENLVALAVGDGTHGGHVDIADHQRGTRRRAGHQRDRLVILHGARTRYRLHAKGCERLGQALQAARANTRHHGRGCDGCHLQRARARPARFLDMIRLGTKRDPLVGAVADAHRALQLALARSQRGGQQARRSGVALAGPGRLIRKRRIECFQHILDRREHRDRLARESLTIGDGAYQPAIDVDRAAAHSADDVRLALDNRPAIHAHQDEGPAQVLLWQHPEHGHIERLDLDALEHRASNALHAGTHLFHPHDLFWIDFDRGGCRAGCGQRGKGSNDGEKPTGVAPRKVNQSNPLTPKSSNAVRERQNRYHSALPGTARGSAQQLSITSCRMSQEVFQTGARRDEPPASNWARCHPSLLASRYPQAWAGRPIKQAGGPPVRVSRQERTSHIRLCMGFPRSISLPWRWRQ